MAEFGYCDISKDLTDTNAEQITGRPSSVNRDREDRVRQVRDRQNEERLRKLNEIKQQALQAQKLREQKEEERRKRIEELRVRDHDHRSQVEERKRLIEDAERDRREAIVRKNQEREARIETRRRNDRASSVFAFGSSTPRMLEPAEGSFWNTRRATSTTNVMFADLPLSRRSSEREVDGSKKRATSAGGLDRDLTEDFRMSTSMYEVFHWHSPSPLKSTADDTDTANVQVAATFSNRVARRRTDLMPTIPSPRDGGLHAKPFTRSPGRAYSMTRLDQLAQPRRRAPTPELDVVAEHRPVSMTRSMIYPSSTTTTSKRTGTASDNMSMSSLNQFSRSMSHLAGGRPLRKSDTTTSMMHLNSSRPLVSPRMNKTERMRRQRLLNANSDLSTGVRSGEATPSRPGSALSGTSSVTSSVTMRRPASAVHTPSRRPRPASIAGTGLSFDHVKKNSTSSNDVKNAGSEHSKPPLPHTRTKSQVGKIERIPSKSALGLKGTSSARSSARTTPLTSPSAENVGLIGSNTSHNNSDPKSILNTPKRKGARVESTTITNGDHIKSPPITNITKVHTVQSEETSKLQTDVKAVNDVNEERIDIEMDTQVSRSPMTKTMELIDTSIDNQIEPPKDQMECSIEQLVSIDETFTSNVHNIMSVSQPPPTTISNVDLSDVADMSASMIAKIRITTEEEAKAALAERRRLAREEAERQAELERQRLEEEARQQEERERLEEEEQRRFEEETLRLANEQRAAEENRLHQAIEEAQRREEEERLKRIEEEKQKAEKEEAERKAREEAEKQRIELAVKLEKEEKEREARRKRVEAIMLRTRGRGSAGSNSGSPMQVNNESEDRSTPAAEIDAQNTSLGSEENVVRNGTDQTRTDTKQVNNCQFPANKNEKNTDNNTNNVLREVQLQTADSPVINTRQLSVDGEFNAVVEQQTATAKVPLNGSNVVNIFEQHITSNANELSIANVDVITNEDTINSNKSVDDSQTVTDLA